MFARAYSLLLLAVPVMVAANVVRSSKTAGKGIGGTAVESQCNTGTIQCCNSVQEADSAQELLALLGIVVGSVQGLVGIDCTPVTLLGLFGTNSCNAQTVCCTDNSFEDGLVNIGCTPINLTL